MTAYDDLLRALLVERFDAWVNDASAGDDDAASARASRSRRRVCSRELRVRPSRPLRRREQVETPPPRAADGDQGCARP